MAESATTACGCKGIRSCFLCEKTKTTSEVNTEEGSQPVVYLYCVDCGSAFCEPPSLHPHHHGDSIPFPGISIMPQFISEQEESFLQEQIYRAPFVPSQSGRRKQDFGPKVNFKKRKLRADRFSGLPSYARFLYERMQALPPLKDFLPVELCNLEYSTDRGAAIDPHIDDLWLWGPRLVTLNLLSDSVLSFTHDSLPRAEVHVPLWRRSLLVVAGDARTVWKHGIHRRHIQDCRVAMTLRELSPEFMEGGDREQEGGSLLNLALRFQGSSLAEAS